jgi:hypothetical protein
MSLRNLQIPSAIQSKLGVAQIFDITDQLPKNPNYTWAQLAGVRDINNLTTIGIHHDAWPKKNRANVDDITFAKEIAQDHIDYKGNEKKGDAGFPYHLWIRNGKIYQTNDILDRTYGIGGNNGYIVHICVSGDYYSYDTLTDPDRNALYAAILAVKAVLPQYKGIVGHCELNPKNCPGFDHKRVKLDIPRLELEMKSAGNASQVKANAYRATEQHRYLYNQYIADPVANKYLEPYLLKMDEVTREYGMYFGQ